MDQVFTNEKFRGALWNRAPIGLALMESSGKFLDVNPAYCELTGYSGTELLELTFMDITHPQDLEPDRAEAKKLASSPASTGYSMVKRYCRKDGRIVWVDMHVQSIWDNERFLFFLVHCVPLPSGGTYRVDQVGSNVVIRPAVGWLDLIANNPKATILGVVALLLFVSAVDIKLDILKEIIRWFIPIKGGS